MIRLSHYSGVSVLEAEQFIDFDIDTVWNFFSDPSNLSAITPPEMNFVITGTDFREKTYAGQIITYSLTPFAGIRANWVTEITHLEEKRFFTDEQRFGPYSFWHHRHIYKVQGNGTHMKDIVTFKLPGWIAGRAIGRLFIEPKLFSIFSFRENKIREIFNAKG